MSWQPDGLQPSGWQPDGWQPTAAAGAGTSTPPRARFFARYGSMRTYFFARLRQDSMNTDADYVFDDVTVNPGEQRPVELDLYSAAVSEWRPNEEYTAGAYVRPRMPNGFAYQAGGSAGLSGATEPYWPKTLGATRQDGSITWTCVAAGTNGLSEITSPSAAAAPVGMTISAISVENFRKIRAVYSNVVEGSDQLVVWTFTLDGNTRIAHQRVIGARK